MLRRMVSDPASDSSGGGGGDATRTRGGGGGAALFAVPRLFVGFAAKLAPDGESSRSPTSPLDPKALLLRSPRSPRPWGAPGLVDALAGDTAANCLLSPRLRLKSYSSLPKDCGGGGGGSQPELGKTMSCPAPDTAAAAAGGGGMSVPCSRFQFHRGDLKSGPEPAHQSDAAAHLIGGAKRHSFDLGKLPGPGSLPACIAAPRFVGSVSASEIEQSEDYTRIIARGPNPKTTHIFGDCILEPRGVGDSDEAAMEVDGGAAGGCYFVVKRAAADDDFLSSCFACKKKLEVKWLVTVSNSNGNVRTAPGHVRAPPPAPACSPRERTAAGRWLRVGGHPHRPLPARRGREPPPASGGAREGAAASPCLLAAGGRRRPPAPACWSRESTAAGRWLRAGGTALQPLLAGRGREPPPARGGRTTPSEEPAAWGEAASGEVPA